MQSSDIISCEYSDDIPKNLKELINEAESDYFLVSEVSHLDAFEFIQDSCITFVMSSIVGGVLYDQLKFLIKKLVDALLKDDEINDVEVTLQRNDKFAVFKGGEFYIKELGMSKKVSQDEFMKFVNSPQA